jgi:glycogen debranching enzyme
MSGEIHRERSFEGLYVFDTRVLSHYGWRMNGARPAFSAGSNVEQFSWLAYAIQAPEDCKETPTHDCNPLEQTVELRIWRQVGEGLHEEVHVTNHTQVSAPVKLELEFELAFVSQTEVEKGRKQHGKLKVEQAHPADGVWEMHAHYHAEHAYSHQGEHGVAKLNRGLILRIENAGSEPKIAKDRVSFQMELAPHQSWHACLSWISSIDEKSLPLEAVCLHSASDNEWDRERSEFFAKSTGFSFPGSGDLSSTVSCVLRRAAQDLEGLRLHDFEPTSATADGVKGIALAAGIPTYQEIFGRDMEASSWQAMMLSPEFARGTLNVLNPAAATEHNDWRDAEPGRLPHDIHTDPLSELNFRPKSLYFGSVTSCTFFPIVVAELYHWTGDLDETRKYIDTAMGALHWADTYSLDATGFYRYKTSSEQGVKNQGWKDSQDAIVYPDGSQVDAPIGTCEMQAFMYAAKQTFSEVMFRLGHVETARRLYREASELKERFNEKFWMEDEGYYAMGIDSRGDLIRSIASDPGHCLLGGIVDSSRVKQVAARLMRPDLFSGWGIRTLSSDHPAYNPFSYHRGSVWPVTTAAFVMGFARYGLYGEMHQAAKALFEAAELFEHDRLPEVFGGHPRTEDMRFPGVYTDADFPQAWSAGAPFTVIRAMLGLVPYAPAHLLVMDPHLPEWLPEITVENLRVGRAKVTLRFKRNAGGETDYQIVDLQGPLHIVRQPSPWSLTAGWAERISDAVESLLPHRKAS